MSDMAMCGTKTCPSRNQCYRHRAIPRGLQRWNNFDVIRAGARVCPQYEPIFPGRQLRAET